ncbi:MAG: hypothetical protein ACK5N8_01475 [Alphaproteobacteria bacterium]
MFSDSNDENNKSSNPNIEWKKKGFGNNEKTSRRIDTKKAEEYEATTKKTNVQNGASRGPITATDLPKGLKKLRKKIIQSVYDDEEDEDELETFQVILDPNELGENNSLISALNDKEKKILEQKNTLKTINNLQNAGKLEALNQSQKLNQKAGLGRIDRGTLNKEMLDVTYDERKIGKTIKKNISKKLKVNVKNLPEEKYKDVLKGVKAIRELGGRVEGMRADKVAEAGKQKNDKRKVAEIIYDNARNKEKTKFQENAQKANAKKVFEKTGRIPAQNLNKKEIREQTIRSIENSNTRGNTKTRDGKSRN